jgi:hypothetical protein
VNAPRMSGFGAAAISMAALGLLKPATSIPATPDLRHQSRKPDEVFVRARFVDGDCGSRIQNTNVVKGDF